MIGVLADLVKERINTTLSRVAGKPRLKNLIAWLSLGAHQPEDILIDKRDSRQTGKETKVRQHVLLHLVDNSGAGGSRVRFGHHSESPAFHMLTR